MKEPNYILKFNDGFLMPKKTTLLVKILKLMLYVTSVALLFAIIFRFSIIKEIPMPAWLCFIIVACFVISQSGCERKPTPCELWFYDDYLIQYCERRQYNKRNIRMEYYKFYYKDIEKCLYRTVSHKFDIYGYVEATFYKYNEDGKIAGRPSKHVKAESISVFYTVFEPSIDFVKEIETHSPIKVEFEES